ncbi:TERB2 protein, partial [Ibidorhyncha struthersii]|nr:TERB2 protein [Ibidorhyncha struthersii]
GRRAWFSQSVSPGPRELWVAGGGVLAHRRDADYLFSSDAAHPDTRRIHESLDYLEGRATVFHSCYLSAWVSTGAAAKPPVVLGHFVLPPACLQEGEGTKKKTPKHHGFAPFSEDETGSGAQREFLYRALREYPLNNMVTGYTSARDMKKYVGELHDFIPGTSGYSVYWVQNEINISADMKARMKRKL